MKHNEIKKIAKMLTEDPDVSDGSNIFEGSAQGEVIDAAQRAMDLLVTLENPPHVQRSSDGTLRSDPGVKQAFKNLIKVLNRSGWPINYNPPTATGRATGTPGYTNDVGSNDVGSNKWEEKMGLPPTKPVPGENSPRRPAA